jgi:hypothetical protein
MKTKILTTLLFLVLTLSPAIANSPTTYTVSVNVSWTELTEHEVYSLRNHLNEFLKKADKKTSTFNLRVNKERQ